MSLESSADGALPDASSGQHKRDTAIKLAMLQA